MSAKVFVDTNVLVYAHDVDAGPKQRTAENVLEGLRQRGLGVLSMQVLQEFYNTATRKLASRLPKEEARAIVDDFSHWCVVCERLIDTEPDVLALCAERAHHVHARVGYDQGPQVPHPAALEYQAALEAHERWWTQIWQNQLARGVSVSTLTPEFGPDGYLHCAPFTGAPVADLSQINAWMGGRQKQRFAGLFLGAMVLPPSKKPAADRPSMSATIHNA